MGLILDSSVLIVAERKGSNARQVLNEIAARAAGEEVGGPFFADMNTDLSRV